ncbi:uncharacterized protein N7483_006605 [Penicillium malachiteum]|uniref:uncharacterized protein n=1 Tax=Penicillium malachiteum TaxID=1324776 RepID=UPI0025492F55|nr:uncharacterized protein N7483_006605 [Penicillium malachiteum]KAJ5725248.1 hypothetical protein N7483_006605 [Penicillium malachiteum]
MRRHTKSKRGCDTCKARHVKCGEEQPHCQRCVSTKRQCSYTRPASDSPQRQLGLFQDFLSRERPVISAHRERRAFEYYYYQAGPALCGVLDSGFWRTSVLQMCRNEPAIWDAIISLSALYERPPIHEASPFRLINNPAEVEHPHHHEALVWYSRSLAALRQRMENGSADLSVLLTSSLDFVQTRADMVINAFRPTDHTSRNKASVNREFLISVINPIFRRFGTWALVTDGNPNSHRSLDLLDMDVQLSSIDEARNALHGIVRDMKILNVDTKSHWSFSLEERIHGGLGLILIERQRDLRERLNRWHKSLISLFHDEHDGNTALLLMTYTGVLIEIETCLCRDQMLYDSYETEFAQIINHAPTAIASTRYNGSQPPFLFETGVFLPLFITALKCRFPQIRRQALQFLHEAPPAQGLFLCRPAAHAVAVIVELEEGGNPADLDWLQGPGDLISKSGCVPPSESRIWDFSVSSDKDLQGMTQKWLHYRLRDFGNPNGDIRFIQRTVLFPGAQS